MIHSHIQCSKAHILSEEKDPPCSNFLETTKTLKTSVVQLRKKYTKAIYSQPEADTGFSERGGVACPMSGCLTSGHFPGGRLAFFFLSFFLGGGGGGGGGGLGVGQLAGEFFMCYFNMVLNEITCPGHL